MSTKTVQDVRVSAAYAAIRHELGDEAFARIESRLERFGSLSFLVGFNAGADGMLDTVLATVRSVKQRWPRMSVTKFEPLLRAAVHVVRTSQNAVADAVKERER